MSGVDADVADPFVVGLERFQGPLDLLLHLIRKQDIDIFDIPIARITEQFLAVVRNTDRLALPRAGEFLEMAATLIRIKAQLLFPSREEDEEDDPRADLVRRLLEYEHFREAATLLEDAERRRSRYHGKGYVESRSAPPLSEAPLETVWDDVWEAAMRLAAHTDEPDAPGYRPTTRLVTMDEKVDLVLQAMQEVARVEFAALVEPWGTRMHAVMSLLACLELSKRNMLMLRQTEPYAPLWIYRAREIG